MSSETIYKCDGCGKVIPHANHPALAFGVLYETYDFCDVCAEKFKKFLGELKND